MRCPTLNELPSPPPGKTGWPWTAESSVLSEEKNKGLSWPRISIVTPSFNQAPFLEATIRSVLLQGYPNLEYVVIDGGSKDGSVEIIRKYEPYLSYWISKPDEGQYHAINEGFEHAGGEIMAWLNSDDMYIPNSFRVVGEVFTNLAGVVQWISGVPSLWDEEGFNFEIPYLPRYTRSLIRLGFHDERGFPSIQQESTFWSRQLWFLAGGLDLSMKIAADFDLWRRFACYADLYLVTVQLAGFRVHRQQKTALYLDQYYAEIDRSLANNTLVWWLNKVVKSRQGRRIIRFYQKIRRSNNVISYNPKVKQWEIKTWEMSR